MKTKTAPALAFALMLCVMFGCSARQVLRERDYGVVAIPSNTNAWPFHYRDKADELMREHFPEGYEIVREEEVVVGQTTHFDQREERNEVEVVDDVFTVGTRETRSTATTRDQTEWRIHYQRVGSREAGPASHRFGETSPRSNGVAARAAYHDSTRDEFAR